MMDRPNFEAWWEEHGQYGRAGGGEYEKTFAYNAWVSQAERIRVLREALNVATNWLSEDRCPLGWTVSRLRDTIEATK